MPWVPALRKDKNGTQKIDEIHSDNNKPQHKTEARLHKDAHEGDGKRRLGQGAGHDGQGLANLGHEGHKDEVLGRRGLDVFNVSAEAPVGCGQQHTGICIQSDGGDNDDGVVGAETGLDEDSNVAT